VKIFGREPTLILQSLSALLSVLVAFGLPNLSAEQAALIVAALSAGIGVANGLAVRPIAPAAFVGLVGAVAALLAGYGLEASQEVVGSVSAAVVSALALLTRGQVTPNADPRSPETVVG
jgi:pilus assembly protein TadC